MTTEQDIDLLRRMMERVRADYEMDIARDDRQILHKVSPVLTDEELDYLCQRLNANYMRD